MDDYGTDSNKMLKIVFGLLVGLLAIMLIIPLAANIIATQTVADAANQALSNVETNTSLPSSANNIVETENTEQNQVSATGTSGMYIIKGSITTGSSLSSKSTCKVFVGREYSGAKVMISTLYSRDGTDLNAGKLVEKTVDSDGYVSVNSAESFKLYPDSCLITLYDSNGNELDYRNVYLATESGTQSF